MSGPSQTSSSAVPADGYDTATLERLGHEIRTPLNTIVGLCHLCMQTRLDEHQRQYLSKMLTAANDLLRVCESLPARLTEADMHAAASEDAYAYFTSAKPPSPTVQNKGASSRVLLVEDNEINQEIASELLHVAGLENDVAANGQEALDAVERVPYGLIFMDVQMPVMGGLEATRRLRAQGCTIPIIAMTAHAAASDIEASLAAGMNAHLSKPLEPEALFAAINTWMPSSRENQSAGAIAPRSSTTRLPDSIEGFNLDAGLSAVGNNAELYASLLQKFASRHATIAEEIFESLQKNNLSTAIRLAHTVRGIAANLGATSLSEAASTLEKTLNLDPSMAAPHLKLLVTRLDETIATINAALSGTTEVHAPHTHEASASSAPPPEEATALVDVLASSIANMETDWTAAYTQSLHVRDMLAQTSCAFAAQNVLSAVENFETDIAKNYVHTLRRALHSALHSALH